VFYSVQAIMWNSNVEYSDIKADIASEEWHDELLLLAYEKFILHHDRLDSYEQNEYRSSLPMNEQIKWAS